MHTISHTIVRSGAYHYNRRVPKHAVDAFGGFVRVRLSKDPDEAEALSERLTDALNKVWAAESVTHSIDLKALLDAARPQSRTLHDLSEEYLALRRIDATPVRSAVNALLSLAGNKNIEDYDRSDARALVAHFITKGSTTATVRRRVGSISAILNYGYAEHEIEKRNPFARLMIEGEGEDAKKRGTFTVDQLRHGYETALQSGSEVRLLMPLLGETGCRIAEVVGAKVEDVDLDQRTIRITPNAARRLKTKASERELPLVGHALKAATQLVADRSDGFLFSRYLREGRIMATHASNAVNKWLKRDFDGLTAHCLRHTFRDRLREVECPLELIDQLGGWSSITSIGTRYGAGYSSERMRVWLERIAIG